MGASLGLAGLAGCRRPDIKVLPYNKRPEDVVLGLPTFYATSLPRPGSAFPVLVETREGRPIKIEGNPKHPASLGATDLHAQSTVLDLYDPDRSSSVLQGGQPSTWEEFDSFAKTHFEGFVQGKGRGLAFLSEDSASPALIFYAITSKHICPKPVGTSTNRLIRRISARDLRSPSADLAALGSASIAPPSS